MADRGVPWKTVRTVLLERDRDFATGPDHPTGPAVMGRREAIKHVEGTTYVVIYKMLDNRTCLVITAMRRLR